MQKNWDGFYARVLKDEGTYFTDTKGDNGGPTNCGITIFDVAKYYGFNLAYDKKTKRVIRGAKDWDKALAATKALNPSSAAPIYKKFYWDACRADDLPSGIDYMAVDFAVNSGVGRSAETACKLTGLKPLTMSFTDALVKELREERPEDFINHFQDARQAFLIAISDPNSDDYAHNYQFRRGWLNRVQRVRETSLALARQDAPVDAPVVAAKTPPKAMDSLPPPPPPSKLAVATKSKTVRHVIASATFGTLAKVKVACTLIGTAVASGIDAIPDIYGAAADQKEAFVDLGNTLGATETIATVFAVLAIISAIIAAYRHTNDKRELVQLKPA